MRDATPQCRPLTVMAYDHTGNMRAAHYIESGDLVDWKRNGTRGAYRCEVQRAWRSPGGYTWLNKEAEWQVILLEELAEEFRRGA